MTRESPLPLSPESFKEDVAAGPDYEGAYVLGCFDMRVTFKDQQVRAINLAVALGPPQDHENSNVAVIGAGVAGCTAAVALAEQGWTVTVFEKLKRELDLQAGCRHRWIHPNIYDWPFGQYDDDRARLPHLDWKAGACHDVIEQLRRGWKAALNTYKPRIEFIPNVKALKAEKEEGRSGRWEIRYTKGDRPTAGGTDPWRGSKLVVAVGFGKEDPVADGGSYWDTEALTNLDPGTWVMVTGDGDGALTDVMRACIEDFDHGKIVGLAMADELEDVRARIRTIESRDRDSHRSHDRYLYDAYQGLSIPESFKDLLKPRDVYVVLNHPREVPLTSKASALNRFLVRCLIDMGVVEPCQGKILKTKKGWDERKDDKDGKRTGYYRNLEVETMGAPQPATEREIKRLIVRHGPRPALESAVPWLWKYHESVKTRRNRAWRRYGSNRSRVPIWSDDRRPLIPQGVVDPLQPARGLPVGDAGVAAAESATAEAVAPEAGTPKTDIQRLLDRFGMLGLAIDDSNSALMRIARELYATAEPPEWWIQRGSLRAGIQALEELHDARIVDQHRFIVAVDRFLPVTTADETAVDWEWEPEARAEAEQMRSRLNDLDLLTQLGSNSQGDRAIALAVTSYPPGLVQKQPAVLDQTMSESQSQSAVSASPTPPPAIHWVHRSRHPFHRLRKELDDRGSDQPLLHFVSAVGERHDNFMIALRQLFADEKNIAWLLVTGSGMSRAGSDETTANVLMPGQPRNGRLLAEAAWRTLRGKDKHWLEPRPEVEPRAEVVEGDDAQRKRTREAKLNRLKLDSDTGLYEILSTYQKHGWVWEAKLGTLIPGPMERAVDGAMTLDWTTEDRSRTSLKFLEGLRIAVSRFDQGHTHQHWVAAQLKFGGCITTNFDYLHERARDYLRVRGVALDEEDARPRVEWPILRLYDPGPTVSELKREDVSWQPVAEGGDGAFARARAFVERVTHGGHARKELGFLVVGHRLLDPTLWSALQYVKTQLGPKRVKLIWVDPDAEVESQAKRVEIACGKLLDCSREQVLPVGARAIDLFYELASEWKLGK